MGHTEELTIPILGCSWPDKTVGELKGLVKYQVEKHLMRLGYFPAGCKIHPKPAASTGIHLSQSGCWAQETSNRNVSSFLII